MKLSLREKTDTGTKPPIRLGWLVLGGVGLSTGAGAVLFYAFVWQQLNGAWVWSLNGATGQQLFDAARTTVTLVGIIGLGGAAFIAIRRQRTTESTQVTAAQALVLSQSEFQHESTRALRDRYTAAAEQLGSDSFALRLAGVYALSALADDWAAVNNTSERQVCVDLLCAYLRTPVAEAVQNSPRRRSVLSYLGSRLGAPTRRPAATAALHPSANPRSAQEREVRQTILRTIAEKTADHPDRGQGPWADCRFDFSGAELENVNFTWSRFNAALRCNGTTFVGPANFRNTIHFDSKFTDATFTGVASFKGGKFLFNVDFDRAQFLAGADFRSIEFKMQTTFYGATFNGRVSFDKAHFTVNSLTSLGGNTFGSDVLIGFNEARFNGEVQLDTRSLETAKSVMFHNIKSWNVPPTLLPVGDPIPSNFDPKIWPPPRTGRRKRAGSVEEGKGSATTGPQQPERREPFWTQITDPFRSWM
ncbi:hypothetical protein [Rhodococcoides fascians]|uniref:hypothetical protein n=1 Tax=Rhodococcoides fascians TaxID=1828 RepID=UPI00050CA237|nr:hypothetical protein [Rhodococcus fascians]